MAAGRYDLQLDEGCDLSMQVTLQRGLDVSGNRVPLVLTGYSARAKITRRWPPARISVVDLTVAVTDATNGILLVTLTPAQIAALGVPGNADPFERRILLGSWDLVTTSPLGLVEPWLEGECYLSRKAIAAA